MAIARFGLFLYVAFMLRRSPCPYLPLCVTDYPTISLTLKPGALRIQRCFWLNLMFPVRAVLSRVYSNFYSLNITFPRPLGIGLEHKGDILTTLVDNSVLRTYRHDLTRKATFTIEVRASTQTVASIVSFIHARAPGVSPSIENDKKNTSPAVSVRSVNLEPSSMPPTTSQSTVVSPTLSNAPPKNYSTVVRTALQGIKRTENDLISSLAEAMCLMSEDIQAAVTNTSSLSQDVVALRLEQSAIEGRVKKLETSDKEALDLSAAALTRAKNVEPYTLVFTDVPLHPDVLTPDFLVHVGSKLNVAFFVDCIMNFWRAPRSSAGETSQTTVRLPDLYVKFKFARLRDSLLAHLRKNKGLHVEFPGISAGTAIRVYEVLTGERHAQFLDIRGEGQKIDVNVWHLEGAIRGRAKSGGKPIHLYKPSDVAKLAKSKD